MPIQKIHNGKTTLEFFPSSYIDLQVELNTGFHVKLVEKLAAQPVEEIDLKIACIATHCKVILDGTYTLEDREKLCAILLTKLKELREGRAPSIILL